MDIIINVDTVSIGYTTYRHQKITFSVVITCIITLTEDVMALGNPDEPFIHR